MVFRTVLVRVFCELRLRRGLLEDACGAVCADEGTGKPNAGTRVSKQMSRMFLKSRILITGNPLLPKSAFGSVSAF